MSQNVTINGKKFVPSAELARSFGYSLDYISRLAREGKVDATRIGRQWFVDAVSLKHFVEQITEQKIESRRELREKRKEELKHHNNVVPSTKNATLSKVDNVTVEKKVSPQKHQTNFFAISSALLGTTLTIVAGALFAAAINPTGVLTLLESSSESLAGVRSNEELGKAAPAGALGSLVQTEDTTVTLENSNDLEHEGVIIFDTPQSSENLDRVRNSFSDEVEVTFEGSDTGVITPVFKHQTGDDYQFLLVPLNEAS